MLKGYEKGTLYLVRSKHGYNKENEKIIKLTDTYEGTEDLSYHGSPWYETFLVGTDLETGNKVTFGSENYNWKILKDYIDELETKLKEINSKSSNHKWN